MAAPNIVNVTTITGKSAVVDLTGTSATAVVENACSQRQGLQDQLAGGLERGRHKRCRHHDQLL
jgi:hypothetical protein